MAGAEFERHAWFISGSEAYTDKWLSYYKRVRWKKKKKTKALFVYTCEPII